MHYSFEIEIDDFANSWYLHVNDANCEYTVELGRKPKYYNSEKHVNIQNDYLYVTSSNVIEAPNDHVLFERNIKNVYFKDVKTNIVTAKDITSISFLRNIVRIYPYDVAPNVDTTGDGVADEGSLRGSSEIVAGRIRDEIQQKVAEAGLEIIEARITYLAYAPEIAAVMLQRQQASAIIDARKMIVDGAVGMVEMALERLNENNVVELDEERKAAMVSNLLVVLCGNHDAQPVVNSGSLY